MLGPDSRLSIPKSDSRREGQSMIAHGRENFSQPEKAKEGCAD